MISKKLRLNANDYEGHNFYMSIFTLLIIQAFNSHSIEIKFVYCSHIFKKLWTLLWLWGSQNNEMLIDNLKFDYQKNEDES